MTETECKPIVPSSFNGGTNTLKSTEKKGGGGVGQVHILLVDCERYTWICLLHCPNKRFYMRLLKLCISFYVVGKKEIHESSNLLHTNRSSHMSPRDIRYNQRRVNCTSCTTRSRHIKRTLPGASPSLS